MGRAEWTVLGLLAAAFLGGAALASGDGSQVPWVVSRVSGIAAFVALSTSMVLGLLISTKAAEPRVTRVFSFEIHGFVGVLSLTLVGIHGGALLFDSWFHFTPLHLIVPFAAPYAPIWTGLGVISAWAMALVTASFWFRKQIGYRAWRRLHYLSFGAYVLSLGHGITAGTDSNTPFMIAVYATSVALVAGLMTVRIAGSARGPRAKNSEPREQLAPFRP